MRRGFTLLEVMVALAILAVSLVAITGVTAANYAASEYARDLTVATLLARSKMIDIEHELWEDAEKDGKFPDEKEMKGDFDDEDAPAFRWRATVRKIDVDVGQLVGSLLGGDVNTDNFGEHIEQFISGLSGGTGLDEDSSKAVGGSDLAKMIQGDQLEAIFKQVGENLAEAIREVELEIAWGKEGKSEETVKFVQYITTNGRFNTPTAGARLLNAPDALGNRNPNTLVPPPPPGIDADLKGTNPGEPIKP